MTDVDITYVNGYIRVKIKGHAGYGKANGLPEGQDIVCAAVSILGQTLAQYLMDLEVDRAAVIYQRAIKPGEIDLRAMVNNQKAEEAKQAAEVIKRGFDLLADRYPEYVRKGWGHGEEKCDMV